MTLRINDNDKYCGGCCWFRDEDVFGIGNCYNIDRCMHYSDQCKTDEYVSNEECRHHIAVLIQANRYRRDPHVPAIYRMPAPKELGKAIDFAVKYLKTFDK